MKRFRKAILPILENNRGKPRLLNRLVLFGPREKFIHRWISKHLEKKDIVLDVGARTFPYSRYQEVRAIFGIDLPSESEGYLGFTDETLERVSPQENLFPILANCEEMPFEDNSFDKIIMIEVIEHVERDELAISELARVLKAEGQLFITTPNGDEVENTNPHHLRHYHPDDLILQLEKYFGKTDIQLKFPNQDLYTKQYLPQNSFLPKALFWGYIYEIWFIICGKKNRNDGYTSVVTCSQPKNRSSKDR